MRKNKRIKYPNITSYPSNYSPISTVWCLIKYEVTTATGVSDRIYVYVEICFDVFACKIEIDSLTLVILLECLVLRLKKRNGS